MILKNSCSNYNFKYTFKSPTGNYVLMCVIKIQQTNMAKAEMKKYHKLDTVSSI